MTSTKIQRLVRKTLDLAKTQDQDQRVDLLQTAVSTLDGQELREFGQELNKASTFIRSIKPHGNSKVEKTAAHRAAISASLKETHGPVR